MVNALAEICLPFSCSQPGRQNFESQVACLVVVIVVVVAVHQVLNIKTFYLGAPVH